ncbi:MAG TPA: hypothetical protein PKA60_01350 [Candidatus Paceibacterota bacterium]|nr:hypothetical protein [Candidatus Paceibacterota bacterium]
MNPENNNLKKEKNGEGEVGPLIGSIIIILLIAIGGFYYFKSVAEKRNGVQQNMTPEDEIEVLNAEINSPELEKINQEIDEFQKQIEEAINNI